MCDLHGLETHDEWSEATPPDNMMRYQQHRGLPPDTVCEWADVDPMGIIQYHGTPTVLSAINDSQHERDPFNTIADIIEEQM